MLEDVSGEPTLYHQLHSELEAGRPAVLATIVRAWGSTPREVGASMLVDASGRLSGTVGGGCGEAEVYEAALEMLESGQGPLVLEVDLTEDTDSDSGKVCGGRFEVLVELWPVSELEMLKRLLGNRSQARECWLVTCLGSEAPPAWKKVTFEAPAPRLLPGQRWLLEPGRAGSGPGPQLLAAVQGDAGGRFSLEWEGVEHAFYAAHLEVLPQLLIAGAGHISRPLAQMALTLGFRVVVYDDRADYAHPRHFPEQVVTRCGPFEALFDSVQFGSHLHLVLVTRGHRHDQDCLRRAVGHPFGYVGMIGSQRRIAAVVDELLAEGAEREWLDQLFAPIGLDIGAQTPAEIALCILAEIIALRRLGRASEVSLRNQGRKFVRGSV